MHTNKNISTLLLCFGILLFNISSAQGKTKMIQPLSIGDPVPDIAFSLVNYPSASARLSSFKGKYIILDFWATWCSSCLHNFPKLDSLQQEYKDNLQIILANTIAVKDNTEKIISFFDKRKNPAGNKYFLPTIINDTVFDALFPHRMIPHYVWIDEKGIVQAITSSDEITRKNVTEFINGNSLQLRTKKDLIFDPFKPLFVNGNGGDDEKYIYRSLLSGYRDGLSSSIAGTVSSNESEIISRILCINSPILTIYEQAYPRMNLYPKNQLILDVTNRNKYLSPDIEEGWKYDNTYTYELIFPATTLSNARKLMQEDLKRYFGLNVHTEQRKVNCLLLKRLPENTKGLSKNGAPQTNVEDIDNKPKYWHNYPMSTITTYLNAYYPMPVIDETNLTQNISIVLPLDFTNLVSLKTTLAKFGFTITEEQRELEFFILSETNNKNNN